jgi:glycine oxidase
LSAPAVIVGGGLIGLLSARALRARGLDVVLIERGPIGREASWAGGGILAPLYPWRFPDAVNALARASAREWPELARTLHARTGIDPQYRPGGMLVIDDDDPDEVAAWAQRMAARVEPLPRAALATSEPRLAPPPGHAWLLPDVASIRNPRLLRALAATVVGEGVTVREHEPVERIDCRDGRATAVVTAAGRVAAGHVVVCAGAWSPALLAGHGADPPHVRPVRGQMLAFEAEPDALRHVVLTGNRYLIPRRDGTILAGSTVEETGFDKATTEDARAALARFAGGLLPDLAGRGPVAHWAGLRPASGDGVPTIAPHPRVRGLWTSTGHYRNGVVTAPASARLLADLVAGATPDLDPAPYAWLHP